MNPSEASHGASSHRRESTRKRQQTSRFDPLSFQMQIEADQKVETPPMSPIASLGSPVLLSTPHIEIQQASVEGDCDGDDSDGFNEEKEVERTVLLLGIPGFPKFGLPQTGMEREPRFVNSRQYRRIIKRWRWREQNAANLIKASKEKERIQRQGYKYKSRHLHAKRRLRGAGGKFLTKEEIARMEKKQKLEQRQTKEKKVSDTSGRQFLKTTKSNASTSSSPIQVQARPMQRQKSSNGNIPVTMNGDQRKGLSPLDDLGSNMLQGPQPEFWHPFLHGWSQEEINDFSKLFMPQ
mmetsp:Transcript_20163/g.30201  ORF Transcript_20163/g.30201 Transcript_20163/m.30201 type:complete len:294 (-) Transcript_20163:264-1145(-)